ncbi:MAG: FixH family protein [Pseudomonadota bacterium]
MTLRDTDPTTPVRSPGRPLTGRRVLAIALTCFGVILAVNITMLSAATGTFPGLVVDSAYRKGVGWNERAEAQAALGWQVEPRYENGELVLAIDGRQGPVRGLTLAVTIGLTATARADRSLTPVWRDGAYRAPVALEPGYWRIDARTVDGPLYESRFQLRVPRGTR